LWTAVTAGVTVFVVRRSRSGQVAQELLGERFWGWLVTGRWRAYTWYPTWRRQLYWAHLLRDIAAMIERGGPSQALGEALQVQVRQMFHWWHRVRDGTLAHASFARYMRPIRRDVERTLAWLAKCRDLLVRYEKKAIHFWGLRQRAWALIWMRLQARLIGDCDRF